MVWQNLWSSIDDAARKQVLLDFIKLDDWSRQNYLEFQELGLNHSVSGGSSILAHLAKKLEMGQESTQFLCSLASLDFADLRYFCSCLIESAKACLRLRLVRCITPQRLDEVQLENLKNELEKELGTEVLIRNFVDPGILGGSIVEIDYVRFDSSHARYIKLIEKRCIALLRGAN